MVWRKTVDPDKPTPPDQKCIAGWKSREWAMAKTCRLLINTVLNHIPWKYLYL